MPDVDLWPPYHTCESLHRVLHAGTKVDAACDPVNLVYLKSVLLLILSRKQMLYPQLCCLGRSCEKPGLGEVAHCCISALGQTEFVHVHHITVSPLFLAVNGSTCRYNES